MHMWRKQLKYASQTNNHGTVLQHPDYAPEAQQLFDLVITETMMNAINPANPNDPILQQFLPHRDELRTDPDFSDDPVGDQDAIKATGVIHKYNGRVLLIASGHCAVNCRYCFRRHFNYSSELAARKNWHDAVKYISGNNSIHEVILSGGDPLTLSTRQLQALTDQLRFIAHVKTLRIHTRIPVVMPERMDDTFCQWLQDTPLKTVVVIHCNHPNELTTKTRAALQRLHDSGATLLNQSVLLKGINDDADILTELSHQLFESKVMPYYLNLLDKVQNASHFLIPEERAISIHKQLKKNLPGYLVPKLTQEISGEPHKTTVAG